MLDADQVLEFLHEGREAGGADKVVARRETVTGVDADANSRVQVSRDLGEQILEFRKGATDRAAVATHGFEDRDHGRGGAEGRGESGG